MTVDTLDYVKTLESAGSDRKVAEAHAGAFRQALKEDCVTKHYFDSKVAEVKADILLMKWMLGFVIALCVAILVKLVA